MNSEYSFSLISFLTKAKKNKASYITEEIERKTVPYALLDEFPVYPGCTGTQMEIKKCMQKRLSKLVINNFNTKLANNLGLSSGKKKIWMVFKINQEGKIEDLKVRAPHPKLKEEAERIVSLIPVMKPGKKDGKIVKVGYQLPIGFVIE